MKRLYQQEKWKRQSRRRQAYEEEARRRWLAFQRVRHGSRPKVDIRVTYNGQVRIAGPSEFCFLANTEEMIRFFNEVGRAFKLRERVHIDLSQVTSLSSDALTVLLSKLHDPRFRKKMRCAYTPPVDPALRQVLQHSGFYKFVRGRKPDNDAQDKGSTVWEWEKESGKKVQPDVALDLTKLAARNLNRPYNEIRSAYRTIVELMGNTHEHASSELTSVETWWVTVYCEPAGSRVAFTFVDNGVGIFESYGVRRYKKASLATKVRQLRGNQFVLSDLLQGLVESGVGDSGRGNGLPYLKKDCDAGRISNVIIISNDVWANLADSHFVKLKRPFRGTFIYWELEVGSYGNKNAEG